MENHPELGTAERAFQQAVENAESNKKWLDKNFEAIKNWLSKVTSSSSKKHKRPKNVRLPRSVIPTFYDIEIKPDIYGDVPENFKFYGSIQIHIRCETNTTSITLHKNKLRVNQSSIAVYHYGDVGRTSLFNRYSEDTDRQFMIVYLKNPIIVKQKYVLEMQFEGDLREDLAGLYRSSYQTDGKPLYVF